MTRERRSFNNNFKEFVARLIIVDGYTAAEISRTLDVSYALIGSWKQKYLASHKPDDKPYCYTLREEGQHLRRENKRLKKDCEALKRTTTLIALKAKGERSQLAPQTL